MKASWPKAGSVDEILVKSSQYLMETAHSFRISLKNHHQSRLKVRKGQEAPAAQIEKPTLGRVWVAKTFPAWQSCVLTTMKTLYDVSI